MPRQRMVKPDFFDSDSLAECSIAARLTFIGLWVMCDDYGNAKANFKKLKRQIFPIDDMSLETFVSYLVELEAVGCIKGYERDGERYINVPNFSVYQYIKKPSKARNPEPKESVVKAKRTAVLQQWGTGTPPVGDSDENHIKNLRSTPPVPHQYGTGIHIKKERNPSKEGFKEEGVCAGAAIAAQPPIDFEEQAEAVEACLKSLAVSE